MATMLLLEDGLTKRRREYRERLASMPPERRRRFLMREARRKKAAEQRDQLLAAAFCLYRQRERDAAGLKTHDWQAEEVTKARVVIERYALARLGLQEFDRTGFYGFKKVKREGRAG